MKTVLKLLAVLVVCVLYFCSSPIPDNFSEPWKLRRQLYPINIGMKVVSLLDSLGIYPMEKSMRNLIDYEISKDKTIPDDMIASYDTFDDVKVRVYRPKDRTGDPNGYPGMVYFHGGGWYVGKPELYDPLMLDIAKEIGMIIYSVNYRLAPEHLFPAALDDCVTVTKYVLEHAKSLGVNSRRIAIAGDSAGGNLAAAVALKLRDDNFKPMPKLQILLYPITQVLDLNLPSYVQNEMGPLLTKQLMAEFISMYAVGSRNYSSAIMANSHTTPEVKKRISSTYIRHEDLPKAHLYKPYKKPNIDYGDADIWNKLGEILSNPYFSPLMADDLSGLPTAYIYTCHYDVLRDEAYLYGKRLQDAGVKVVYTEGVNSFHGVCPERQYKEGEECYIDVIRKIKENLH